MEFPIDINFYFKQCQIRVALNDDQERNAKNLLSQILSSDRKVRSDMKSLVNHDFFKEMQHVMKSGVNQLLTPLIFESGNTVSS